MNKKPYLLGATSAITLFVLAACGSGNNNNNDVRVDTSPIIAPTDAFVSAVQTTLAGSPEDTEAPLIDSIAVTSPEDNEPIAI